MVDSRVSSDRYFADVERLIAAGELQMAAERLNAIAQAAQADPRLHMLGMQLAEAAGNTKAALESARRAVARAPEWAPAAINLALLHGRLNQFPEALAEAERAVALAPKALPVLKGAIEVAQRAGDAVRSARWLDTALEMEPSNDDYRVRLALSLSAIGEHDRSLKMLDSMLEEAPSDTTLRETRALARTQAGQTSGALADWNALVEHAPDNAIWRYRRDIAAGNVPAAAPVELVSSMFDKLADVYDMHVLRSFRYRLPKDVADRILELHPDRKLNLLDLGCGTGLLGLMLQRIDGAMIGVDASLKMIEKAAGHGFYNRFHHVDLMEALETTPESLYEAVAALDVFIYVGDLSRAISNAYRILTPGGRFFFSCEMLDGEAESAWSLSAAGRYVHRRDYVLECCAAAGFEPVVAQDVVLRQEAGAPVSGWLIEAVKPKAEPARKKTRSRSTATKKAGVSSG
ncbi:MAG TPA: methyltransferase domain-containing protein [Azoarcus taiwanensis]|nr:methyltransferase domain-containing protein [Azoarcus taiwanensis]